MVRILVCLLMASVNPWLALANGANDPPKTVVPPPKHALPTEIHIVLRASKNTLLLGEPLTLELTVTNVSDHDVVVSNRDMLGNGDVWCSDDGVKFKNCWFHPGALDRVVYGTVSLKPKECRVHRHTLLQFPKHENGLLFSQPGDYWLKVGGCPPYGNEKRTDSNTIKVKVGAPNDGDAEVFKKIHNEDMLRFLEGDMIVRTKNGYTLDRVFEILEKHPGSGYEIAIKQALRKTYEDGVFYEITEKDLKEHKLTEAELAKICKALDIKAKIRIRDLFADDKRLGSLVNLGGPKATTEIAIVLKQLTAQSEVSLYINGAWKGGCFEYPNGSHALCDVMDLLAGDHSSWHKDGDGYVLKPKPEEKK